ncbi:hypothetical protein FACS1894205_3320 [Alphaproteobacteria bacterium]|nr:hypothetical protein FACS1894205_3320 [Alphaproteobacteria bacterium]
MHSLRTFALSDKWDIGITGTGKIKLTAEGPEATRFWTTTCGGHYLSPLSFTPS